MDTFSHIVIGLGVGSLAQMDPAIANHPALSQAVILGAVIGSNAPDIDFIYLLKGKGGYIRNHRGISHSLPALPIWGCAASAIAYLFFPGISFLHVFLWTFFSVILHVILDLLNVDGTQVLLPFSRKWIAFDALPLMDPYLLALHFLGFSLLPFYPIGRTFFVIYGFMIIYLLIRASTAFFTKKQLQNHFRNAIQIKLIPRMTLLKWNIIIETREDFMFGVYYEGSLNIEHSLSKKIDFPELVAQSKNNQYVSDFLSATHFAFPFVRKCKTGYFVDWQDLRFRTKKFFPFRAILFISLDLKNKKGYIGWLNSLKQYKKVLRSLKKTI